MNVISKILMVLLPVFLSNCEKTQTLDNLGTDASDATIRGRMYKADGKTPVGRVAISIVKRDALAAIHGAAKKTVVTQTVQTDDDGYYLIDSCPAGVYVIDGADRLGNAVRIDSVVIQNPEQTTTIAEGILKQTGSIEGQILLENSSNYTNIFVLVFGSDRFVRVDDTGYFVLKNMAYGHYDLKVVCVAEECYQSLSVSVTVAPGSVCNAGIHEMPTRMMEVPENVRLVYDSLLCRVTLTWKPCENELLAGYKIYRYQKSMACSFSQEPQWYLLRDEHEYIDESIVTNDTFVYAIAAVNKAGEVGPMVGPFTVVTTLGGFSVDTIAKPKCCLNEYLTSYWNSSGDLIVTECSRQSDWMNSETSIDTFFVISYDGESLSEKYRIKLFEGNAYKTDIKVLPLKNRLYALSGSVVKCYSIDDDTVRSLPEITTTEEIVTAFPTNFIECYYYNQHGSNGMAYVLKGTDCDSMVSVIEYDTTANMNTTLHFNVFGRKEDIYNSCEIMNNGRVIGYGSGQGCETPYLSTNGETFIFWFQNSLGMFTRSGKQFAYMTTADTAFTRIRDLNINNEGQIAINYEYGALVLLTPK